MQKICFYLFNKRLIGWTLHMIMCVLLCYPVSIHMSQLQATGRPISSFQTNYTKFGRIHLYPMKYLPTKFELDWCYSFWVIRAKQCTDRQTERQTDRNKLITITLSYCRALTSVRWPTQCVELELNTNQSCFHKKHNRLCNEKALLATEALAIFLIIPHTSWYKITKAMFVFRKNFTICSFYYQKEYLVERVK